MQDKTDQQLVELVQGGNKKAFNLLVTRYQHKVASLLSRYLHKNDIPDVAQETFIKAFRSINSFRGDSAFYTWLYRIAVNSAKNHLICQSRRTPAEDVLAEDAENTQIGANLHDITTPENALFGEEVKKKVFDTIHQLPEELRMAITLREMNGLSYEEISQLMDCPIGTVRSRIFRAREMIEAELAPLL